MTPEMQEREKTLGGTTQRIETGVGKVYITINDDENGDPFEVFINVGSSGGYTNSWAEALAMVTSVALRSGADPADIIEVIGGNRSPSTATDNGDMIFSVPDAVAVALRRHIEDKVAESVRDDPASEVGMP